MDNRTAQRFWSKTVPNHETGCIEWKGTKKGKPGNLRPKFRWGGKWITAYRFLWQDTYGELSSEQHICHSCDNPICVNLEHLWLGNVRMNMTDKMQKGRCHSGKENNHGKAKINSLTAKEIRELYAIGSYTYCDLATQYGLHPNTIAALLSGQTWKTAGGPLFPITPGHANVKGEKNPNFKMTEERSKQALYLRSTGKKWSEIAKILEVAVCTLSRHFSR